MLSVPRSPVHSLATKGRFGSSCTSRTVTCRHNPSPVLNRAKPLGVLNCNSQHLLQHIFGGIQRQQKGSKARHASRQHLVTPSCALDHEPTHADAIDWHAAA